MGTPRTKIPNTNIAGGVVVPVVSKVTGAISENGNRALDGLEILIGSTQETATRIKKEIYAIQSKAIQEAAILERKAIENTNAVLSDAATTAYDNFLKKIALGRKLDQAGIVENSGSVRGAVSIDVTPGVTEAASILHRQAQDLINRASERVQTLSRNLLTTTRDAIGVIDTTLKAVDTSLTVVLKATSTFRTLVKTLRVPLAALRVAIAVIKAIPLPQRYLVVSFTILESDLLEMMEQLISQAEEEIRAIEAILAMIDNCLRPLRDRIRRIRAMLNALKTDNLFLEASDSDLDVLDQAGIYDRVTGGSIFDVIQDGQKTGTGWENYGDINLDLTDPQIGGQIQDSNPGDYINFGGYTSGSYVEDYYKWQVDEPPYPKGRPETEGWSRYPDRPNDRLQDENEKLWRLSLLETGTGIVFGGFDDPIVEVPGRDWEDLFKTIDQFKNIQAGVGNKSTEEGTVINYDPLTGYRYGRDVLILDENNFDQKPGILKPSSWDALQIAALNKLRNLPLSSELQEYLTSLWQESAIEQAGTSTLVSDSVAYRAANGELYYLRVIEDEHSPKVAVRRYVEVRDEGNTVILEGTKTFSLDKEALIEEMKFQLDQMTR